MNYFRLDFYQKIIPLKGKSIFSFRSFKKGDRVIIGKPIEKLKYRTWLSLQFDQNIHLHIDFPFSMVNHSCNPNCGIQHNEYGGYDLIALRTINTHEEIVFDYAMTEWECVALKKCMCQSKSCRGSQIEAKSIDPKILNEYSPYLSEYIKQMISKNEI